MTITERITARLDAMESAARSATPGSWYVDNWGDLRVNGPRSAINGDALIGGDSAFYDRDDAEHTALNQPAAVLALVGGLRKVVALHTPLVMTGGAVCTSCGDTDEHSTQWPCPTLTALAAALDPVGEGSEGAEAAAEAPRSAATPVRRVPSHDDGCKDARETR